MLRPAILCSPWRVQGVLIMRSDPVTVDERLVESLTDERDIEAEQRRAQASGDVFEGQRYGGP